MRSGFEVQLDAQAGCLARVQESVLKGVASPEDLQRTGAVLHVFLYAEVVDGQPQVQGRRHTNWRDIGWAVNPGLNLVLLGEGEQLPHGRNPAGVRDGRPDIINKLLADQGPVVPDGVEDLACRERSDCVLADNAESLLVLRRSAVL